MSATRHTASKIIKQRALEKEVCAVCVDGYCKAISRRALVLAALLGNVVLVVVLC